MAKVSILTRPYGRMLLRLHKRPKRALWFQSSPALTGGCYLCPIRSRSSTIVFQSSPALTGGCYCKQHGARYRMGSGFNPHPPLRADAISRVCPTHKGACCFNPHPPLRADAINACPPADTGVPGFNPHPPLRADAIFLTQALDLPGVFSPFPRSPLWQVWNLPAGDQG